MGIARLLFAVFLNRWERREASVRKAIDEEGRKKAAGWLRLVRNLGQWSCAGFKWGHSLIYWIHMRNLHRNRTSSLQHVRCRRERVRKLKPLALDLTFKMTAHLVRNPSPSSLPLEPRGVQINKHILSLPF